MKDLINFQYGSQQVRTVIRDGQPWFVAKDVCECLELDHTSKAIARLDDDEKGTNSIPTLGGKQDMLTVNEPGLYALIFGSRKPEAKAFKRWVTHEVLPAIRQTGTYSADAEQTASDAAVIQVAMNAALTAQQATEAVKDCIEMVKQLLTETKRQKRTPDFQETTVTVRRRGNISDVDRLGAGGLVTELLKENRSYADIAREVFCATGEPINPEAVRNYANRLKGGKYQ